jgi:hypothetical protein
MHLLAGARRRAALWLPLLLAGVVTWSVLGQGLPELRHDWRFPLAREAMGPIIAWYAEGWSPYGLGSPQPYPTLFPMAAVLGPLFALGASRLALVAFTVFATILLAARSAMRIATNAYAPPLTAAAVACVATLNPWVYAKYVAGHPYMILAYVVLLAMVAEITSSRPRTWALCLIAAGMILQLQFFLIAAPAFTYWCVARRQIKPLFVLAAFALPIVFGMIASYSAIRGTPYILDWQDWASVPLAQGALLTGYGLPYAQAFARIILAQIFLAFLCLPGIVLALRTPIERTIVLVACAALLFASGTHDFIAPFYRFLVLRFPESGVYRELYDLIALVAIAYVVLLARALPLSRAGEIAGASCAFVLALPWLFAPVANAFVPARALAQAAIPLRSNERVALFPAFQPLSFEGRGSGTDPDAYVRDDAATPVNEWFPSYPVDAALAYAERDGDDRELAALGVSSLIMRPYLRTDAGTLRYQRIPVPRSVREQAYPLSRLTPMPLLSLRPERPLVVSIGDDPAENSIFFGDAHPDAVRFFTPSRATHDPARAWVDARLSITTHPENGTAFGGVLTNGNAPLSIAGATALLARVDGELRDDRKRLVATSSARFHRYSLAADARYLRCRGTCVVALAGTLPKNLPEHHLDDAHARTTLALHTFTPWLAVATLPPGAHGTLRYNVRYDAHWLAFANDDRLTHFRLDAALNGWSVPPLRAARRLILVEAVAAIQAVLEGISFIVLGACLCANAPRRPKAPPESSATK